MKGRTAYRTLLIRRRVEEIPPEQLVRFIEVQEAFRRWATGWYKSGFKAAAPAENPLKYFANELKYALKLLPTNGLKNGVWKVPLVFNAQLRINNEKDMSRGVFVDLPKGEVRIRKWGGGTIAVRLRDSEAKWIVERVKEGGRLVLALAWVGRVKRMNITTFNLALVFARKVVQYQPKRLLAVDLNALHNGIVWAVVDGVRVLRKGVLRPDVGEIGRLQREVSRLDSLCSERGEYCKQAMTLKSRLWRLLRKFEDEVADWLVHEARRNKAAVVIDVPEDESMRQLKESGYAPERKIFLNLGRLRRRLRGLAEWYGIPYKEERLYSTVCPHCGGKMEELPNRRVKCQQCGFKAPRDEVPILWAVKRFSELAQPPSFSTLVLTPLA
ncbi:RNA-guided endonuclease InsQ/TnpB family protein [Pyrobaculum aerophilum]|uniref:RNA-guided endonuclease InsQ/TnpB family protein n=1 Tax=Pyrobaculum aerophilum TaxID=13773 RepID=UPI0023F553AF|nr:transposase [Pyrobaculum aerophilum]MCX8136147.1 transposase [Pyrobaculum aerophilum]